MKDVLNKIEILNEYTILIHTQMHPSTKIKIVKTQHAKRNMTEPEDKRKRIRFFNPNKLETIPEEIFESSDEELEHVNKIDFSETNSNQSISYLQQICSRIFGI